MHLFQPKYVWIVQGWYPKGWWNMNSGGCSPENLLAVLNNSLAIIPDGYFVNEDTSTRAISNRVSWDIVHHPSLCVYYSLSVCVIKVVVIHVHTTEYSVQCMHGPWSCVGECFLLSSLYPNVLLAYTTASCEAFVVTQISHKLPFLLHHTSRTMAIMYMKL